MCLVQLINLELAEMFLGHLSGQILFILTLNFYILFVIEPS